MANKREAADRSAKVVKQEKLKTQEPLSEKDEVKKAEERLNKSTDRSVAADLKNRKHE